MNETRSDQWGDVLVTVVAILTIIAMLGGWLG